VHLDQAVGWCAGKADKGGVQAGEAGLQQRCSQLETALLQGLQQVCRLCDSVQIYDTQSYSNGMHTACRCCGYSKACFRLLVHGQWGWLHPTWKVLQPLSAQILHSTAVTAHLWRSPECKVCNLLHGCKAATCLVLISNGIICFRVCL